MAEAEQQEGPRPDLASSLAGQGQPPPFATPPRPRGTHQGGAGKMIHVERIDLLLQVQILGIETPGGTESSHQASPEHSLSNRRGRLWSSHTPHPRFQRVKIWQAGPGQVADFI